MNRLKTKRLLAASGIIAIKADKSGEAPDVDQLLVELGNHAKAIPFLAIYPAGGGQPITLSGLVTQDQVLDALTQAGPSKEAGRRETIHVRQPFQAD